MNDFIHVHVRLMLDGHELEAAVPVPAMPSPRRMLLPVLQNLTDAVIAVAEKNSPLPAACSKGCDACCRQMVPISPSEAYALGALINALPPGLAADIQERFDVAAEALEDGGLLKRLAQHGSLSEGELRDLDRDYFAAGVACPFLVDHACSIHAQRPLACREFLVTSSPEHCVEPGTGRVVPLPLPAKVSVALAAKDQGGWLPLVLARRFVAVEAEGVPEAAPREVLQQILEAL